VKSSCGFGFGNLKQIDFLQLARLHDGRGQFAVVGGGGRLSDCTSGVVGHQTLEARACAATDEARAILPPLHAVRPTSPHILRAS